MFEFINENPTVFVAVCAISVPVFITLIENIASYVVKMHLSKKEYEHKAKYEKRQIYVSYLKYTGQYLMQPTRENRAIYGKTYFQVLAIVPVELRKRIIECNGLITDKNTPEASKVLESIIPEIQDILDKTY